MKKLPLILALLLLTTLAPSVPRRPGRAPADSPLIHGTALVVALTPDAVVFGQDQLQQLTFPDEPQRAPEIRRLSTPKFVFCAPDTVCGFQGLAALPHDFTCSFEDSAAGVRRGGRINYDANQWIPRIEQDTDDDAPRVIADRIWQKARATFDPIECFYFHTKEGQHQIEYDGPVMFVVAGYPKHSKTPEVYAIKVQYDRQNGKLAYPPPEKIFPKDGEETLFLAAGVQPDQCWCYVAGEQDTFNAIKANQDPFGAIFRGFYAKRLPAAQLSLKDSPTATQKAVAWVASFIDLEGEFDQRIGGGSSIAIVRKGHSPDVIRLDQISSW
jgi:hypothetical protein